MTVISALYDNSSPGIHGFNEFKPSENRIGWIDTAKGLAILLVVMGHVTNSPFIGRIIYSFHMPLFFMISGLFIINSINRERIFKFIYKRFLRLYIPSVLIGLFILIPFEYIYLNYLTPVDNVKYSPLSFLIGTLFGLRNDWTCYGHLWFLPCLFVSSILLYLFFRYSNRPFVCCFICSLLGIAYNHYIGHSIFLSLDAALIAVSFLSIGIAVSRYRLKFNLFRFIIVSLLFILSFAFNYPVFVGMYTGIYGNYLAFYGTGICGSLIIFKLAQILPPIKILQLCGKNSLAIYGIHYILLPITGLRRHGITITEEWEEVLFTISISLLIITILNPICTYIRRVAPFLIAESSSSSLKSNCSKA